MDMICEINFHFPTDPSFPARIQCNSGQGSRDILLQTTKENSLFLFYNEMKWQNNFLSLSNEKAEYKL